MALSKVADAREFSDEALAAEILTAKRKLFQLRLEKATGRLETTHNFKHTRRWIAQLLTVERERELAAEEESVSEETPSETLSTVETYTTEAIAETEPVTEEE
jgi:large subunit ribosomal protein L29